MIKVANILPVNCISSDMPRQEYEMYLTHKVLEHPELFKFLANDKANNINSFKILDNSACELGEGLDFDKVLEAADIIGADEIVLPDIPRSGKSLTKTLRYLIDLSDDVLERYNIAAVVQGETYEQVITCADQILSLNKINTIMIPKWYCSMESTNGLGRHNITEEIFNLIRLYGKEVAIHWLGLDTGVRELITPWRKVVRSVDTGYLAALSTPQWSSLSVVDERPRELKINLENMDVDMTRWTNLTKQLNKLLQEG